MQNFLYVTMLASALMSLSMSAAADAVDPLALLASASRHPDQAVAQKLVTTIHGALTPQQQADRGVKKAVSRVGGLAPDGGDSQAVIQLAGDLAAKINAARGDKAALAKIVQQDLFGETGVGRKVFIAVLPGGGNLANSIMTAT